MFRYRSIEDIPEDDIPAYITETKLNRDDLKNGQKAALVIRLHYKDGGAQGKRTDLSQDWEKLNIHEKLAKMAGISKGSIGNLITVYKRRTDLFERVFNGEYSINRAYTQMKADEQPEGVKCANCSPLVVPSLPADTRRWSCGMRSWSFRIRFVVRSSLPIASAMSPRPFCPRLRPTPFRTPQYLRRKSACLASLIGSDSACPRLLFPEYFRLFPDNIRRAPLTRDPLRNFTPRLYRLFNDCFMYIIGVNRLSTFTAE
ncbi:hypothetical protein JOC94_004355 [Bacillus thermophilus]|uniref:Uncharacterized protein n=1 Tax=Siminovitchia thermophila TaxID=1245522 RepID=A0ABS2REN7_9BACI|nr:hypothetical protein [Siminovitchia thermophila]